MSDPQPSAWQPGALNPRAAQVFKPAPGKKQTAGTNIQMGSAPKSAYGGEFEEWKSLAQFAKEDVEGAMGWTGSEIKPILSAQNIPIVPIEDYFGDFFTHIWQKRMVNTANPQKNMLAQTRAPQPKPAPSLMGGHREYKPMLDPNKPMVNPATVPVDNRYLKGIANDWKLHEGLDRVMAYTFRGDTRNPDALKAANGFHPPSTRDDDAYIKGGVYNAFMTYLQRRYQVDVKVSPDEFLAIVRKTIANPKAREVWSAYSTWRVLMQSEELHLGRMVANEALKGYISTSSAVQVAKGFAKANGWVYVTFVNGGFVVPQKAKHLWTSIFGEQEVALPGPVTWENIQGFRQVDANRRFKADAPVFLRKGFKAKEPAAFQQCYELLSGKKQ